jgi:hypothetical protein
LTELGWVIGLLSGSYRRLIKLAIRWMCEVPILRGLAIEALSRVVKPTDALEWGPLQAYTNHGLEVSCTGRNHVEEAPKLGIQKLLENMCNNI